MLTWASAQDYRQPGLLKDVQNAWPSDRGYVNDKGITNDNSLSTFGGEVTNGISVIRPDGSYVGFCSARNSGATHIRLYLTGANVSRAGNYANLTDFHFASTADFVYATNGSDPLQKISLATLGNFADVANCPRFKIIITAGNRLWGFNTTANITYAPVTYNANGSRWWVSALGNFEDFAPSVASGAATDLLDDQDGEITAAIEFDGYPIVFKKTAIYRLEDDGAFVIERKIHSEFGCIGPRAVTKVNNRIFFVSPSNGGELCMYDGNTVTPVSRNQINLSDYVRNIVAPGGVFAGSGGSQQGTPSLSTQAFVCGAGRYVFVMQALLGLDGTATLICYDTVTNRFGRSEFSFGLPDVGTKECLTSIWESADNTNLVVGYVKNPGSVNTFYAGVIIVTGNPDMAPNIRSEPSIYFVYREQRAGQKATVNSGKAYFMGDIPPGTVQVVGLLPTQAGAAVNLQPDGRWSAQSITAQRHETAITITSAHEILDIEIDVASGGKDQVKPRGKI